MTQQVKKTILGFAGVLLLGVLGALALRFLFNAIPYGGYPGFLAAQIQESVSTEKLELASSRFYIRILAIGLAAALLLFGVFVFILVMMKKLFSSQSQDLREDLRKLQREALERERQLEILTGREIARSKEIARLKDEFIFIAAHELRAPVAAIEGNIFLFLADAQAKLLPKEQREILEDVRIAAGRLSQLVIDLLNVARIESGTIRIAFEKTNIGDALLDAIRETAPLASLSNIRVVFDQDILMQTPPVMGDRQRLQEVFGNILANAIKYNVPGGTVTIGTEPRGEYLALTIRDTGIGMNEEELEHLFVKFWRANPSIEGTGLGLWISKQIVEKMHGAITVESLKGKGTTFRIFLKVLP